MSELTPDEVRRRRLARLGTTSGGASQSPADSSGKLFNRKLSTISTHTIWAYGSFSPVTVLTQTYPTRKVSAPLSLSLSFRIWLYEGDVLSNRNSLCGDKHP